MTNEDALANALTRALAAIPRAIDQAGKNIVRELQAATGRAYPPASQPGQPPAKRSGRLQAGFKYSVDGTKLSIYNDDPKFKFPEEGTRHMRPRPSLSTIGRDLLETEVAKTVSDAMTKAEKGQ